jgi:hypothetical protein
MMTVSRQTRIRTAVLGLASVATLVLTAPSMAIAAPIGEISSSHIGWKVDKTTGGSPCTVASKDECQPGEASSEPGGFTNANSVAVAPGGEVYVADTQNNRVQELNASGAFVLMFGEGVNKTKIKEAEKGGSVTHAEENVCIAVSRDECQAGIAGDAAGQFGQIYSVTVDSANNDVYVSEIVLGNNGSETTIGRRVQAFTSSGGFVLEIGKEVNETTKVNLCTQAEKCTAPAQEAPGSVGASAPGAFAFVQAQGQGNMLATGGPEDLLYVGDAGKVQEFDAAGKFKREILLTSISAEGHVSALAVDKMGNLYVVYQVESTRDTVRKFTASTGEEVKDGHFPVTLSSRNSSAESERFKVNGIAVDSSGRLAASEAETIFETAPPFQTNVLPFGSLLDSSSGRVISEFSLPQLSNGLAFSTSEDLYAITAQEMIVYEHLPVGEVLTGLGTCGAGVASEANVTFSCNFNGEANPWKISETEVSFQWGRTTMLGSETTTQVLGEGETFVNVSALLEGLRPNEAYYYRLAGHDRNVKAPEQLTGRMVSFRTQTVPPRIVSEPSAPFVGSSSAVLFAELNPENMNTEYFFEYGPCPKLASCQSISKTTVLKSGAYGKVGVTQEVTGLQSGTFYSYRLFAINEVGEKVVGKAGEQQISENTFTTGPLIVPRAQTGVPSGVGTTSATISGDVNPDGQPATYAFELGFYRGFTTTYGVVFSGSAGAGAVPVTETLGVSGLQPGTTYAYRIKIESGYGQAFGQLVTFTTAGLPSVLNITPRLTMLAIPPITFPPASKVPKATVKCKAIYRRDKRGRCVKIIKRKKVKNVGRAKHQHGRYKSSTR